MPRYRRRRSYHYAARPTGPSVPTMTWEQEQAELRRMKLENGTITPEPAPRCHGPGCVLDGVIMGGDGSAYCRSCFEREGEPGGRFYQPYEGGN